MCLHVKLVNFDDLHFNVINFIFVINFKCLSLDQQSPFASTEQLL